MKRPTLAVRQYRHSSTHPYYLDLRAFNQGRKFFKTKAEADAERLRQITLRERGGREAVGLPLNELSAIVEARRVNISYIASRRGRPTIRSKEVENEICYRIACGESLRHIYLDERMPCRDTVFRWLRCDQKRRLKLRALLSALQDEQLNKA